MFHGVQLEAKYDKEKFIHSIISNNDLSESMIKRFYSRVFSKDDISDENYVANEYNIYGWCPELNKYINKKECHACNNINTNNMRCNYRFKKLLEKEFDDIVNVEYNEEGIVRFVTITKNNKQYKIKYDDLPNRIDNILNLYVKFNKPNIMKFFNSKTGAVILLSKSDIDIIYKIKKCYGKYKRYDDGKSFANLPKMEIYGWNKNEWTMSWYIENKK